MIELVGKLGGFSSHFSSGTMSKDTENGVSVDVFLSTLEKQRADKVEQLSKMASIARQDMANNSVSDIRAMIKKLSGGQKIG
ncbi:hypothetical protein [Photobacterium damselae]|uniref:hypothetical protein n=1 Tax=Photobacterium damselae TaxID=38293 RepID=UPI001F4540C9|nr:hypothetical protein [Photobacterium damselae]UKA04546.1 hypothetical protein IHC89_23270 [Photobacterium damselae subsp. damselae]